jgi:SAM-dependent methyltransferase
VKICTSCRNRFDGSDWRCPRCAFAPAVIDGYVALAPELARASASGFANDDYRTLAALEERHFWFRGRNKMIAAAMAKYCGGAQSFCEIGCGTGFVLHGVGERFPRLALSGSEIAVAGLGHAQKRNPRATLFQMDATDIPFDEEFDVVGAFDVLEHIANDEHAIAGIFRALKRGGHAVITVPQHMFLWSEQDARAGHARRYGIDELGDKLAAAGFRIEMRSSFVTILLPVLALTRRFGKPSDGAELRAEYRLPRALDALFEATLDVERMLFSMGARVPFGGSQLMVAQKPA